MGDSAQPDVDQHSEVSEDASLDEWGWDPMVDQFLLELISEAQDRDRVDFGWVSQQFFEVLDPAENQVDAAADRFSPEALYQRWRYLTDPARSQPQEAPIQEEQEEADDVAAEEPEESPLVALELEGAVDAELEHQELQHALDPEPAPKKGRDRVLDAMQSFLFGLPRGNKSSSADAASAPSQPSELSWEEPLRSAGPSAYASGSGEALRRCLEELRWHGDALRLCASGADAAALSREAAERRKALLWSLGIRTEGIG